MKWRDFFLSPNQKRTVKIYLIISFKREFDDELDTKMYSINKNEL